MLKNQIFDLCPVSGQKSFYGKAKVVYDEENQIAYLYSYRTIVCIYHLNSRKFRKIWDCYSVTTMKHINAFRAYYGLPSLSKSEWMQLTPYEPC